MSASAQQIQTEEIVVYYIVLLWFLLLYFGFALPGADDGLLGLCFFGLVGVLLNKIADFGLGFVIVAGIDIDELLLTLLQSGRIADPDEVEHHLEYLPIILHVVFRLGELIQFIDMCLEVAEIFLVLLDEELDGI